MNILDGLNLFVATYLKVLRGLGSSRLIAPFLLLGCLKGLALAALVAFYLPPVYKILVPVLSYFYSDYMLHYPRYYLVLPQIYGYATSLAIEFIFGVVILASAVFVIGTDYKNEKGGFLEGIRTANKSLLALFLLWLMKTAIVLLVNNFAGKFLFRVLQGLPFADFLSYFIIQIIGILIAAVLIIAIPAIMLHRKGLFESIGVSIRFFRGNPVFIFALLFVPWLIQLPVNYLVFSKVYFIMTKFSHSTLIYLLALDIVVGMLTVYLKYAGVTYFYLNKAES